MKNYIFLLGFLILFSCGEKEVKKTPPAEIKTVKDTVKAVKTVVKKVPEIVFTVQIAALKRPNSSYTKIEDIKTNEENGLMKYRMGFYETYKEARAVRRKLLKKYPGAFVQALKDGNPIPISQALN